MKINRHKLFWTVVFLVSIEKVSEGDLFLPFACLIGLLVFFILDKIEQEYEREEREDYTEDINEDKYDSDN